jgi:thiamine-phosphate pyrophosphorylase
MILHVISDGHAAEAGAEGCERVVDLARRAIAAGLDVFQVREPGLEARALLGITQAIVAGAHGTTTRVVVNDRLDVALAAAAHGVHLKEQSLRPADVRSVVPPGFLVGVSVHSADAAGTAAGADYLIAGTVWPTASKPVAHETIGIEGLAAIVRAAAVPVLAIGGVTADRAEAVAGAGAAGIAAIRLFHREDEELRALAHNLRTRFDSRIQRSYH